MDFLELAVKAGISTIPEIEFSNFEELKEEITERLQHYNNLVIQKDDIKQAKSDKAKLNKLAEAIDGRRKEIKKQYSQPLTEFEKKCKELVELIKGPVSAIDSQIKAFEEEEPNKKYSELKSHFTEYAKETENLIDFNKILNPKWKNSSMKISTLKAEIEETIDRIKNEINILKNECEDSTFSAAVINEYCNKGYSLSKALVYSAELKRQSEIQAKALKQEKENTIKIEEKQEEHLNYAKEPTQESIKSAVDPIVGGCFAVECRKTQLILLRKFMEQNGIRVIGTLSLNAYKEYKKNQEVKG